MDIPVSQIITGMRQRIQSEAAKHAFYERAGVDVLFPAFQEEIETRGHGRWAPLKPATIRAKARAGYARPASPLIATGRLLESLTPGASDNVLDIARDGADYGTSVPYAKYHQYGSGRMYRPPMVIRSETMRDLQDLAARWLMGEVQ